MKPSSMRIVGVLLLFLVVIVSCSSGGGGDSGGGSPPTPTYTIGGTVSGLAETGLVLQNNGGDNLAIGANGSFTFGAPLTAGSAYTVTVATQPNGQTCTISNGSGTVGSLNVTDVSVTCVASGSGGAPAPQTLSGTAAAGGPIIGQVIVKDSTGTIRTAAIAADGSYSISVAGMTPPFLVRAEGQAGGRSYVLHSAATTADINGNINITPLTDLIVANIARQVAGNYFDSGNFSGLTAAELNAAENTLQQRLQAVLDALGVAPSIDLLRTAFSTNHQGLDAALDVLRVSVDAATNTAVITNVINNAAITDDLTISSDNSLIASTGTVSGLSDWDAIRARWASFEAAFATGLPSADDPLLLAQFDQTGFLEEGDDLATFLGNVTTDPGLVGVTFASISLVSLTPVTANQNGRAVVALLVVEKTTHSFAIEWVMTGLFNTGTGGTNWLMAGDQRIMEIGDTEMRSILGFNFFNRTEIQSGIDFEFKADPTRNIHYAVVTGPGLPTTGAGADGNSAGVLLVKPNFGGRFKVTSSPYAGPNTLLHPHSSEYIPSMYVWTDAEIASLPSDNLTYTVKLYDDKGTPAALGDDVLLATYSLKFLKGPYAAGVLSAASFPVITGPLVSEMLSVYATGGPLTVTWSLPQGLAAERLDAFRFSSGGFDAVDADLSPTDTSATIQITPPTTGTPTGGWLGVVAADFYNRNYSYRLFIP